MKDAKERAEQLQRIAAREHGNDMGTVCSAVAGLIMQVDDIERRLTVLARNAATAERLERAERHLDTLSKTAAHGVAGTCADIATLRTEVQQEREAREELAATWAEAWDRRHEP